MKILAIETSCDETAVAVLEKDHIMANQVASQIAKHRPYGGVVPELASRQHTEWLPSLIQSTMTESNVTFSDLDLIAVTYGPGLEGALVVGTVAARTLSRLHQIPLMPINHIEAHMFAACFDGKRIEFPFISLIVSGGHTQLVKVNDVGDYELCGQTRDDAAGEAFDKVARALGLPYPGGPEIQKQAVNGDMTRFKFPIPLRHDPYAFSFSGLKTAVIQTIDKEEKPDDPQFIADVSACFQDAVVRTLLLKSRRACEDFGIDRLVVCGGVTANAEFRERLLQCDQTVILPEFSYCTDNAAMIGLMAWLSHENGVSADKAFTVSPQLSLVP